jgi:hypothetical protein
MFKEKVYRLKYFYIYQFEQNKFTILSQSEYDQYKNDIRQFINDYHVTIRKSLIKTCYYVLYVLNYAGNKKDYEEFKREFDKNQLEIIQ